MPITRMQRAALTLLLPVLLLSAGMLVGWGIFDLSGFFQNGARTALIAALGLGWIAGTLSRIELNPFRRGERAGRVWPIVAGMSTVPVLFALVSFFDRRGIFVFADSAAIRWVGVAAFALGEALRLAALHQLGQQYSAFITVQLEHKLVTSGVYRLIRHPLYMGQMLTIPGAMLVFRSPLAPIIFVITAVFVANRSSREERVLEGEFPESYRDYQRHSWRFLPYVY